MRIWHDNSGKGDNQSWFLSYVAIRDIQTKERFYFLANTWFSVVEGDGEVMCYIHILYTLCIINMCLTFYNSAHGK